MVEKDDEDLSYLAICAALEGELDWDKHLNLALERFGSSTRICELCTVDIDEVMDEVYTAWRTKLIKHICPIRFREIPDRERDGFKINKYLKWFQPDPCRDLKLGYMNKLYRSDQIRVISQFRLCSHGLNCETMRLVDGKEVPRSQRICRLCTFNKVED